MTQESAEANPIAKAQEPESLLRGYAAHTLTTRLERMLSYSESVLTEDMDALKQMRVWSRRSRAALDSFGGCFAEKPFLALAAEVKAVTRALGSARDLDVMIKCLAETQAELPEEQRGGVQLGVDALKRKRELAQPAVVETVERLKRYDLLNRWRAIQVLPESALPKPEKRGARLEKGELRSEKRGGRPPKSPINLQESLQKNGARAILARLEELLAREECLEDARRVLEHHEMRIAAKRLRYTLEIFKEAFEGSPLAPQNAALLQHVRDLQEFLGDIHDADVLTPQLVIPLKRLIDAGYGEFEEIETLVGVDRVDFQSLAGLIAACQRARTWREQRFAELQTAWRTLREMQAFEQARAALESALHEGD